MGFYSSPLMSKACLEREGTFIDREIEFDSLNAKLLKCNVHVVHIGAL